MLPRMFQLFLQRVSCCQHYFVDDYFVGSFGFKNPYIVQAELLSLTRFSWLASNQGQVIPLPMICQVCLEGSSLGFLETLWSLVTCVLSLGTNLWSLHLSSNDSLPCGFMKPRLVAFRNPDSRGLLFSISLFGSLTQTSCLYEGSLITEILTVLDFLLQSETGLLEPSSGLQEPICGSLKPIFRGEYFQQCFTHQMSEQCFNCRLWLVSLFSVFALTHSTVSIVCWCFHFYFTV